jgi:hypothetical protein
MLKHFCISIILCLLNDIPDRAFICAFERRGGICDTNNCGTVTSIRQRYIIRDRIVRAIECPPACSGLVCCVRRGTQLLHHISFNYKRGGRELLTDDRTSQALCSPPDPEPTIGSETNSSRAVICPHRCGLAAREFRRLATSSLGTLGG